MIKHIIDIAERVCKRFDVGFIYGEVISVQPLQIRVDDRYVIDETFIVLSGFCKETIIKIPNNKDYEHVHLIKGTTKNTKVALTTTATMGLSGPATVTDASGHTHEIEFDSQKALPDILLWRGLRKGDKVHLIRFTQASIHFVIERIVGVTNEKD